MVRFECDVLAFKTGRDPDTVFDLPIDEVARQLATLKMAMNKGLI